MVKSKRILQAFALWARGKGYKKPPTKEATQAMFNEFVAEWTEIASKPTYTVFDGVNVEMADEADPNDDFTQMIIEREQVMAEVGGDDLARDVVLREREHERVQKEAAFSRSAPPSATKAMLGGVANVSSDGQNGGNPQRQTVAFWAGDHDSETTPVTVSLGVNDPPLPAVAGSNVALKPYGIVRFGTRGAMEIEVDIGLGTQIVVAGSEVTVDVAMDPALSTEVAASMSLSACLSYGTVDSTVPATRTRYFGQINNGAASARTTIPRFANQLLAVWRNDIAMTTEIRFQDANGNQIGVVPLAANGLLSSPVAIPPNAQFFVVANTGASNQATTQVVFGLGL